MKKKRIIRVTNPQKVEFIGKKYLENPEIQIFAYNQEAYLEDKDLQPNVLQLEKYEDRVTWLNVHGIHESELINGICSKIGMPRFIVQDILDTNQRTKMQDLGDFMFFSVKSILVDADLEIDIEQISFIVGHQVLYSFQEKKGDHFEHIRVRIREDNGLVLLGENTVTGEQRLISLPLFCSFRPVTDDMALCHPSIQQNRGKLSVLDAENAWFIRVDGIHDYGMIRSLKN